VNAVFLERAASLETPLREAAPLAPRTSWRIGGPARWLCEPPRSEFPLWVRVARETRIPWRVLGRGSNVLIDDAGLPGLTLSTARMTGLRREGDFLEVEGGAPLSRLVREAADLGWTGYEFLAGIPGSVGGAIVMNAGTSLRPEEQIAFLLCEAEVMDRRGELRWVSPEALDPGCRTSAAKRKGWVVLRARLRKPGEGSPAEIRRRISERLESRRRRQPLERPSAGSVFKNPPGGRPAWSYIREAGLAGCRVGDAQVSERHANWILNMGRATAAEVRTLIARIQEAVAERFGVRLEREVVFLPQDESGA